MSHDIPGLLSVAGPPLDIVSEPLRKPNIVKAGEAEDRVRSLTEVVGLSSTCIAIPMPSPAASGSVGDLGQANMQCGRG